MNMKMERVIILIFAFLISLPYTMAQQYDFSDPLSFTKQRELIPHFPIWIDIKDGTICLPTIDVCNPMPEFEYEENGNIKGLVLANKSRIQIVYDEQNRVNKIIGPGIKKTIISYPDENKRIVEQGKIKWTYEYSKDGRQLKIVDGLGNTAIKEFDSDGHLTGVIDSAGAKTNLLYDNAGNLVAFTNGLGQKVTYNYNDKNKLTSVIYPSGREFKKAYDEQGNIVQLIDPIGNKTDIIYDPNGNISNITNARKCNLKMEYDGKTNTNKITNPIGETTIMGYDLLGRLTKVAYTDGAQTFYRYDSYNNVTEIIKSSGKHIQMEYDEMGNLIKINVNGQVQFTFSYDVYVRVISKKDGAGNTTSYTYNEQDNLTSVTYPNDAVYKYKYDANGNCISMTNQEGGVTKYQHSPINLLTKVIYPNGTEKSFEYNNLGQITAKTDIRGNKIKYEYDMDGNMISETDPQGNVTKYAYDKLSRLIKTSYPAGKEKNYEYDESGNITAVTDENGLVIKYFYDPLNRVSKVIDSKGNTTEYSYDSYDNIIKNVDPLGNITEYKYMDGNLLELQDPYKGNFKYGYDSFGRLISISSNLGDITTKEYDVLGQVTKVKDILGHEEKYSYDGVGNKVSVTDYNGNVYKYRYDKENRLIEVVDPLGNVYKINYDDAQNETPYPLGCGVSQTVIGPKNNVLLQRKYNKFGDLIEKIDERGVRTSYQYDNFGNIIAQESTDLNETYKYDKWQRLIEINRKNPDASIKYEYDNLDRLTKITYPSGRIFTYVYDKLGRLAEINGKDNLKFIFSYDQSGKIISIQYPNGIQASYEYDPLGRLIKLEHKKSDGEIIAGYLYNYDSEGNVISSKKYNSSEIKYSYDKNNQLTSQLSPEQGKCEYDSNGNVSKLDDMEFIYDAQDRLKEVKLKDGKTISYGYSPKGRRTWKDNGNGKIFFIYDKDNIIAEIKDDKIIAEYLYGPNMDQPLQMFTENNEPRTFEKVRGSYFYHADRIGSINALTDTKQNEIAEYEYDPWGNIIASTGNIPNPYLFTGREYEPESNLYYYRARYYSPKLGQFLTKDPSPEDLKDPLTLNPYTYAKNNPLTLTDPFGLQAEYPMTIRREDVSPSPPASLPGTQAGDSPVEQFINVGGTACELAEFEKMANLEDRKVKQIIGKYPVGQQIDIIKAVRWEKGQQIFTPSITKVFVAENPGKQGLLQLPWKFNPKTDRIIISKVTGTRKPTESEIQDNIPQLQAQITKIKSQIKNFNSQIPGQVPETITGPHTTSPESQAANASTAATAMGTATQVQIDKLVQDRQKLEIIRDKMNHLINNYQNGNIKPGWSNAWNENLQNWQEIINHLPQTQAPAQPPAQPPAEPTGGTCGGATPPAPPPTNTGTTGDTCGQH